MERDLVAYGTPFVDNLVHIDHLPTKRDEGARIIETSWQCGGKVSSALAAYGALGGASSFVGVCGADSFGQFFVDDYKTYNVDTSRVIRDGTNSFSLVLSDPVTKGRNIIGRRGTMRTYQPSDIDAEFVASHKLVHLENGNDASRELARIMHKAGKLVSVDADGYSEALEEFSPEIDLFLGSEFYYTKLYGEDRDVGNIEKNMRAFKKERGNKVVGFTFGELGSAVLWDGGFRFAQGYKVEVVDTVGAGDDWHGGFLFGYLRGWDVGECAQFANAVSAIKCTGIGGRAALPTLQMVKDFMATGTCDRTIIEQRTKMYEVFGAKG